MGSSRKDLPSLRKGNVKLDWAFVKLYLEFMGESYSM